MKRGNVLASGIVSALSNGAWFGVLLSLFILLIDIGASSALLMVPMFFLLFVAVAGIVFGIISACFWKTNCEKFGKIRVLRIVSVVFNVLLTSYGILYLNTFGVDDGYLVCFLLFTVLAIVGITMQVCTFSKCKKQAPASNCAASAESNHTINLASAETFEKKLAKLNAMKEHGIITEEEYSEIKKSYVKEFLG